MSKIRDVISFSRIHTASLTISIAIIAAVISHFDMEYIILFALFALIFHGAGFALNNLCDYKYDKGDPYKKDFPLVSGKINFDNAMMSDIILLMMSYAFGIFIVKYNIISTIFLSIAFSAGIAYNYLNKRSRSGPYLISISFSFLIPYIMLDNYTNYPIIILYTLIAFFTMMYQISVSGFIKDIETPQYNMMSKMGMKLIGGQIVFSKKIIYYAASLRYVVFVLGMLLFIFITYNMHFMYIQIVYIGIYVLLQGIVAVLSSKMVRNQRWMHNIYLKKMSMIEMFNYLSLVFIFIPLYGIFYAIFLIIFPVVWFIIFNKIIFNTTIYPQV